ncbi:MAG: tRNA (adenosine(37)-N6)-threonylcarbamoyltransferase complex ATPase subunit type 1 TsaE [Candidatus Cloacimonetes bacterium]|nr:tRNA (adenosine(37)-N6)-threonylcarbamoyltransferase complex ATPase subunit type 1 TsaE [Candidatus Cloacimonadota bacterium]
MIEHTSLNKKGTENIARNIAGTIVSGDIILLYGELGAGKTYFVNKLCKFLKVKSIVNSPSYVLLNEYLGKYKIYHYDLYRLSSADEAIELGILDRVNEGITIVEWPELIQDFLPNKRIEIFFEHNENLRNIKILIP